MESRIWRRNEVIALMAKAMWLWLVQPLFVLLLFSSQISARCTAALILITNNLLSSQSYSLTVNSFPIVQWTGAGSISAPPSTPSPLSPDKGGSLAYPPFAPRPPQHPKKNDAAITWYLP